MRRLLTVFWLCVLLLAAGGGTCFSACPKEPFSPPDAAYLDLAQFLSRGVPEMMPSGGNDIDIITSGKQKWEMLMADLEAAHSTICMEYYRWREDAAGNQIRDIILRKLSEGVQVKILLEDMANAFFRIDYYQKMRDAGAQVQFFTDTDHHLYEIVPDINYRDHRKIVVIDSKVGYIGGMNLGLPNRDVWKDTHVRITGPAVSQLERLFNDMWAAHKGPELIRMEKKAHAGVPVPESYAESKPAQKPESGPEYPVKTYPAAFHNKTVQAATSGAGDNLLEEGVCRILRLSKRYVYIQTPYFCPSDTLLRAMKDAARRGVDLRILVPAEADSYLMTVVNASFFEECVKAGMHILASPGVFNHSKTIVCDDYLSTVGTLNMDNRSLRINHEAIALVYDGEFAAACRHLFLSRAEGASQVGEADIASLPHRRLRAQKFWRGHARQL